MFVGIDFNGTAVLTLGNEYGGLHLWQLNKPKIIILRYYNMTNITISEERRRDKMFHQLQIRAGYFKTVEWIDHKSNMEGLLWEG